MSRPVTAAEATAIRRFLLARGTRLNDDIEVEVRRWGRLHLPITQIARTAWKESEKSDDDNLRVARNVKVCVFSFSHWSRLLKYVKISGPRGDVFAEILYFAILRVDASIYPVAVVSQYGPPHDALRRASSDTLLSCEANIRVSVVDVKKITSVVAMIPHNPIVGGIELGDRFYIVEKPGLDVAVLGGREEAVNEAELQLD